MAFNHENRRQARRGSVIMSAYCRTATGREGDVAIVDLTADGCCIFTKAVALSEGLRLRIGPSQFESFSGQVRWTSRGYAGIQFDKPLYGPVAEHLQAIWSFRR
jgi:hypothetical protein